jgi:hypothetical protein
MRSSFVRRAGAGGLILALLLPVVLAGADQGKPAPPPSIARLAWLAGNWRTEKMGRVIDEQWMAPGAGVMLGMARTIAKGRVVEHEFIQIREGPGGGLFFVAQPAGQKTATFQLSSLTDAAVVFENPLQEFPRQISYRLQSDGSLLVALEGPGPEGQGKRIEFSYQRVQP